MVLALKYSPTTQKIYNKQINKKQNKEEIPPQRTINFQTPPTNDKKIYKIIARYDGIQ